MFDPDIGEEIIYRDPNREKYAKFLDNLETRVKEILPNSLKVNMATWLREFHRFKEGYSNMVAHRAYWQYVNSLYSMVINDEISMDSKEFDELFGPSMEYALHQGKNGFSVVRNKKEFREWYNI